MREIRPSGSVEGVVRNDHLYSDWSAQRGRSLPLGLPAAVESITDLMRVGGRAGTIPITGSDIGFPPRSASVLSVIPTNSVVHLCRHDTRC